MERAVKAVAKIYTPFSSKFGIPRQSGLTCTVSKIVFEKEYRSREAVRGLDEYSHIWLIWDFSEAGNGTWSPTVRPPRLGGNKRMGVFATRSPFRPNSLALSCVKIESIDLECSDAPVIYVSGADILDGTDIFDIKPYIPYADSIPSAKGGFADETAGQTLGVFIPAEIRERLGDIAHAVEEILSQDPRPHYQCDPDRVYSFEFGGFRIRFVCDGEKAEVKEAYLLSKGTVK